MRKLVGITALFAGLALLFSAGAMPASADPGGANGTVKIHDWPEHKNGSEMANDPKVCQFEIHGFKFDRGQTGRFWIQDHKWGNGDASKAVLSGNYGPADANGDWTSGPYKLADGHYKLFVEMTHTAGNSGKTVTTYKHKVFKVECPTSSAPNSSGSTTTNTSNSTNNSTTTDNSSNNSNSSNSSINSNNSDNSNAGGTSNVGGTSNAGNVVAGFESTPTGVQAVGRDDTQGRAGVNGAESAPMAVAGSESAPQSALAGIASLPATSTGAPALGLAGLAITGLGLALLRRQPK